LQSLFSETTPVEENLLFLMSDVEEEKIDGRNLIWIDDVGLMQSNLMMGLTLLLLLL
jgi:hypothetical protein